jgi:CBS domain-containing protein/ribosome-associated translation inhibitor RaiA
MPDAWPTARDMMTPRPITLSTEAPVSRALGVMRSHGIHELPILRDGRLAGMITFDGIARRAYLALTTKVEHLMVLPPLVTATTRYPELAEQLLAVGLRGAPVVGKKGELIGVVSRTDLVRELPDLPTLAGHRVEEVASPANLILSEDDPCASVINHVRLLEEHPLPVINRKGRLVGAVGIADLGRILWRPTLSGKKDSELDGNISAVTIGTIMHTPPLTVERGATVGEAARAMTRAKVSSVFLVENGRPVGIVGQSDLLGLAVGQDEAAPTKISDVYVQIHGLRGSSDPETLAEIDQLVGKGLKRIARHVQPIVFSLDVSPHAARSADATINGRLRTARKIYFASVTGWNFFASVDGVLDDIESQVRREHETTSRPRHHVRGRRAPAEDDTPVDRDVEAKIRAATGAGDEDT